MSLGLMNWGTTRGLGLDNIWDDAFGFSNDIFNISTSPSDTRVKATDNGYRVEVLAPAMDKSKLKLTLDHNVLRLAYKDECKSDCCFSTKSFERSVKLPNDVDTSSVNAKYDNGVIVITVDKGKKSKGTEIKIG